MKKKIYIIFIVVYISLCIAPLFGLIFGYKNDTDEKRMPAQLPIIIKGNNIDMHFIDEFDDYFSDNFAFRDQLITFYAHLNNMLFKKSVSSKVIIGKQNWLFFEPALDDYRRINLLSENEIYRIYKSLEIQKMYLEQFDIDFIFTSAPNKSSIYTEFMPDRYIVSQDESNIEKLYKMLDENNFSYVNLHNELKNNELNLYHKLDTHWNNAGAVIAYNALLNRIKEKNDNFNLNTYQEIIFKKEKTWHGDLSDMLFPASNILDENYNYNIEKKYTSKRPIKSYEDMNIETMNSSGNLNLLMFRDSFANALIPLISNEFANAKFIRATPYDYKNLDKGQTDIVILEIVERNLSNLLNQAPLLSAIEITQNENIIKGDIDVSINIGDNNNFIKIVGIAISADYKNDENYDIYIRLNLEGKSHTYVPFPINEKGYFEDIQDKDNAAFSMILEKTLLDKGMYTIDIIICNNGKYIYKTLENIFIDIQ